MRYTAERCNQSRVENWKRGSTTELKEMSIQLTPNPKTLTPIFLTVTFVRITATAATATT